MGHDFGSLLREIPSISLFLDSDEGQSLVATFGSEMVKFSLRDLLSNLRADILSGKKSSVPSLPQMSKSIENQIIRMVKPEGRQAINATGILLHTGLGRSPLSKQAVAALDTFSGYSVLQTDLETGKRSLREQKIEKMLIELTGCEAATVVNNNAAATMLMLNTIAKGREVVISRGQLVEIGGAFRMPDVMDGSGAIMHEIGTTNRTHLRDYEAAINENTGALIHVHTSNYRVRGFTGSPNITDLCELREKYPDIAVVDDLGSGSLIPLSNYAMPNEPLVKDSIASGCDLVCFSGDKLIGGGQSGILCGKKEWIQKVRKNPFARMFRVCKMTLAVLETTLSHFVDGTYEEHIPFYSMLKMDVEQLNQRAVKLVDALKSLPNFEVEIIDDCAYIGSGSIPDEGVPSKVVRLIPRKSTPDKLAGLLRKGIPSIFCRIKDESLHFDMRSLLPGDLEVLCAELPKRLGGS